MEPPPVQFVRTQDGFDIAYTVCGAGLPFVLMPWPWSHRGLWWQSAGRPLSEALAERFRLVQYDSRGQGMSTRGLPEDHSIEDYLLDLDAVVERLGLDRFVLSGAPLFGHVAVKYAARHPERVLALVLAHTQVSPAWGIGVYEEIARRDWDLFVHTSASGFSLEGAPLEVAYWRDSLARDDFFLMLRAAEASSIAEILPELRTPTLVITNRRLREGEPVSPLLAEAQAMVATMPDARLLIEPAFGASAYSAGIEPPEVVGAIANFLREAGIVEERQAAALPQRLSPREAEVLRLIAAGRSNQQIAEELVLSVRTVERHITNLYSKIGARGKADATAYALRSGIA